MAYYHICQNCGAHLDPGETCDCRSEETKRKEFFEGILKADSDTGQVTFNFNRMDGGYEEKIYQ